MKNKNSELQKLKGIGEVLSRRLIESSYDTIAKVAAAEEKGLERIAGMSPQKVRSVTIQARKLTGEAEKSHPSWSKERGGAVRQEGQEAALKNRDRSRG